MLLAQVGSILSGTVVFWGAITLMVIVPSLAYYWQQIKKTELDAGLKQSMIDRGMSADEIERVLRAGSKDG